MIFKWNIFFSGDYLQVSMPDLDKVLSFAFINLYINFLSGTSSRLLPTVRFFKLQILVF